tara:strand:- start:18 stop:446 length:429 start_codon:yes stop_codon:yes gene_type:complete
MKKFDISHNSKLYAYVADLNDAIEGLDFLSKDEDFVQVGTMNYKKGKSTPPHYHLIHEKESNMTQEVVIVYKGEVTCKIFTIEGEHIQSVVLKPGQFIVQLYGVHEYIMNEDSVIMEVKNGPYYGMEIDRKRIETDDNASSA